MSEQSIVEVTFNDGEVVEYPIDAGTKIGGYLAREAGHTGVLNLFNQKESYGIPLPSIRHWHIRPTHKEAP